MANLVIDGTTFTPFTGGFTGTVPATGTYYSEGGAYGAAPFAGPPVKEQENLTFNDVDGTATRDRGFRFRPITANVIFCGTVSSVNTAVKSFYEGMRPIGSLCTRFTVSLPDGASYDGCHLVAASSERWENLSGKVLFLISLTLHQMSTTN